MHNPDTVCYMNDSFPPIIDGVATAVVNYAEYYQKNFGQSLMAVPYHPEARDESYPFPVVRYRSFNTTRFFRYRAGYPFSMPAMKKLKEARVDLIHSHCPFMSTILARALREMNGAPVVFTYHTKFDIDIAEAVPSRALQEQALKLVLSNIRSCDEVWAVSRGAGENLKALGFEGEYLVMENGVDYPKGRVSEALVREGCEDYDLPEGVPVFLFVGRMMWYKGLRLVFDALGAMVGGAEEFRMVLIGEGSDRRAMEEYAAQLGLGGRCIFTGAVRDREKLRAWYCRASLFLFPSTYDTNGLVVREAAACGLASVLIAGSCAAEGVTDGRNGFLCGVDAGSLAQVLEGLLKNPGKMRQAGENAMEDLYLSWEESVARAAARYRIVMEKSASGEYERKRRLTDGLIHATANVMEGVELIKGFQECPREELHAMYQWQRAHFGKLTDRLWQKIYMWDRKN